mgnify:CR=1 FL=1
MSQGKLQSVQQAAQSGNMAQAVQAVAPQAMSSTDRKSTRLNSSHT